MERIACTMKLYAGYQAEYKRRHDEIWPEMKLLLKQSGIKEYSIFLDETANILFGYFVIADKTKLDELPNDPLMRKWWAYMKDIMDTNEDNSPKIMSLQEVFYLP